MGCAATAEAEERGGNDQSERGSIYVVSQKKRVPPAALEPCDHQIHADGEGVPRSPVTRKFSFAMGSPAPFAPRCLPRGDPPTSFSLAAIRLNDERNPLPESSVQWWINTSFDDRNPSEDPMYLHELALESLRERIVHRRSEEIDNYKPRRSPIPVRAPIPAQPRTATAPKVPYSASNMVHSFSISSSNQNSAAGFTNQNSAAGFPPGDSPSMAFAPQPSTTVLSPPTAAAKDTDAEAQQEEEQPLFVSCSTSPASYRRDSNNRRTSGNIIHRSDDDDGEEPLHVMDVGEISAYISTTTSNQTQMNVSRTSHA